MKCIARLTEEDNFTVPPLFFVCACVGGYAFMGSLIIQEVVKDLLSKGLDNAKVLLLAGSRYALQIWGKKPWVLSHFC